MRTAGGEVLAEALAERVLGEGVEIADRFPGARAARRRLRAAVPVHPGRGLRREGPHRAAGRLRHRRGRHRHRAHRDRVRRGRLPARRRAGPRGRQPGAARRHLRRAHRPVRRALGQGRRPRPDRGPARPRPAAAGRDARARLPALLALRHAADLLRQAVLVHPHLGAARPAARRERDGRLAPAAHQARPLRQAGWRTTSTGRSRASATGARRCRSGAARTATSRSSARSPSVEERSGRELPDPHRPYVDEHTWPCDRVRRRDAPRARGDRRLVRLGLDAVRPAPCAVRERGAVPRAPSPRTTSARRSTRRAGGSTRCSRSRRCCSTRRRTARCSSSATSPTRRARRCRSRWATSSCPGTSSISTAPTRSAGTT